MPLQFIPFIKAAFSNAKYPEQFYDKTASTWQWKTPAAKQSGSSLTENYHKKGRTVFLKWWVEKNSMLWLCDC